MIFRDKNESEIWMEGNINQFMNRLKKYNCWKGGTKCCSFAVLQPPGALGKKFGRPPWKKSGRWTFGQCLILLAIANMRSVHARKKTTLRQKKFGILPVMQLNFYLHRWILSVLELATLHGHWCKTADLPCKTCAGILMPRKWRKWRKWLFWLFRSGLHN